MQKVWIGLARNRFLTRFFNEHLRNVMYTHTC